MPPIKSRLPPSTRGTTAYLDREDGLAVVFARAAKRKVWGYDPATGAGGELKQRAVPWNVDRLCLEGDELWSAIPKGVRPARSGEK